MHDEGGALPGSAAPAADLASWTWNLSTDELWFSPRAQNLLSQPALDRTFATWFRFVDPADVPALRAIEDQIRRGQRTFSCQYRFIAGDGSLRRIKCDGEIVAFDDLGTPVKVAGTLFELAGDLRPERPCAPAAQGDGLSWTWEQDAQYRFTSVRRSDDEGGSGLAHAVGLRPWELDHAVPLHSTWEELLYTLQRHEPIRGFEFRIGQEPDAVYVSMDGDPDFHSAGAFRGYRGTARDITRRARAEEEAGSARVLLKQVSRLGQLGAWAVRVPGMHLEWSREARRVIGDAGGSSHSLEELLAHLEEPYRLELARAVADCAAQGTSFTIEARATTAGGAKWLRFTGEAERSLTGPCQRIVGAVQDISARKEDALRLRELNEQLITTFESITVGFYTLDRQWRFTYVNHETERVARRSRHELLGRTVMELFPWFAGSRFHEEYRQAMTDGRPRHFQTFLRVLDVWLETYVYPSHQGLAIYFEDITEHKNAQDALRASEERYRLLFELSLDALIQLEHESGRFLAVNSAACQMFRLTEAQLLERGRGGIVPARQQQRTAELLAQVGLAGRGRGDVTLLRGDGTEFEAEISGALFSTGDGVVCASVAVRDVSEVVKYQAEILALNEGLTHKVLERTAELQAANTELRAFAHSLAHDLRTPIAAINTLAHALEQRLDTSAERERHYAGRIRQAAQQLDDYVEALLSHARIAQAPMRESRIDLSAAAEDILADLRLRDPDRKMEAVVQPGMAATGDPALLRMALDNLLGNAWKFTRDCPQARIWFGTETLKDGSSAFCVRDNGAGFEPGYADKIFAPFERLHTQAEFPGTGIGLANVHRIISRHGGRIWAVGRPGEGASFHFTLRQSPARGGQSS